MNKRKLITTVTILILLFSCVFPLAESWASQGPPYDGELELEFNTKLYKGIKANLEQQCATARYNDKQRKIRVLEEDIDAVTTLVLSNYGITDLTGLEIFKNLRSIDLSANKLSEKSNLEVLNSFQLTFLDLSSNQIENVSMITNLDHITNVNLHNQRFDIVYTIPVDDSITSDEKDKEPLYLPQILQKAGFLESEWVIDNRKSDTGVAGQGPNIKWRTFAKQVEVIIGTIVDGNVIPHYGMIRLKIQIKDPTNIMYNSDINLYFITYSGTNQQAIVFKDDALYRAVKNQLTKDQDINPSLQRYTRLKNLYDVAYDNGMFDPAPRVLVIDLDDLMNKITSLNLESKGIADPTGVEWFIGLEKELNLFDNKIEEIDSIFDLKENKAIAEAKMREIVKERIAAIRTTYNAMEVFRTTVENLTTQIDKINEEIQDLVIKRSVAKVEEIPAIDKQIEDKDKAANVLILQRTTAKNEYEKLIPQLKNRINQLQERYSKAYKFTTILTTQINLLTDDDFYYLTHAEGKALFDAQATRFGSMERYLASYERNYLIDYYNIPTTMWVEEQITNPVTGEKYTTMVEKLIDKPIGTYFSELSKNYSESGVSLSTYKQKINEFKTLEVIFKMANYTILDRLYTGEDYIETIYVDGYTAPYEYINLAAYTQYLEDLIESKKDNQQNTFYLESILSNLEGILLEGTYGMKSLEEYGLNVYEKVEFPNTYDGLVYSYREQDLVYSVHSDIYAIAGKFANTTSAEIEAYVVLPPLKRLNIGGNLIESLEGIEVFNDLKCLYARKNQIFNINNVNWEEMTELLELDLAFNDLYDVKCLEVLKTLIYLDLSKNLIEGKFNFDFSEMEKLKKLYFSENRITDISYLRNLLEWIARDYGYYNIAEYMSSPYAIDIRFWGQVVTLDFQIQQSDQLVMIDAPLIFSQLKTMDYSRTIFGANSVNGNLTNDGTKIILEASKLGKKTGAVYVDSGTAGPGIGLGTICTLNYEVIEESTIVEPPLVPPEIPDPDDLPFGTDYTIKGGEYIIGISPNTSVAVFKSKLLTDSDKYSIRVSTDRTITDTEKVATGMIVTIRDNEDRVVAVYEAVVKGDVNGDAMADSLDSSLIKAHRGEFILLSGAQFEAADINQDGVVDALDSKLLLYHRAEIEGYIL